MKPPQRPHLPCGTYHWSHEPCPAKPTKLSRESVEALTAPVLAPRSPKMVIEPKRPKPAQATEAAQAKFDKAAWQKEYMREYMKARRAKGTAK